MRRVMVGSILSLFLSAQGFAQAAPPVAGPSRQIAAEDSEAQTLSSGVSNGPTYVTGWFVAPTMGTTGFGGRLAYSPGLRGGVYLNQRLAIGATFQGIGSDASVFNDHGVRNVGTYGGLLLQYVLESNRLVHATFESTIGSGQWCQVISDKNGGCSGRDFLAFEPVANVEINLSRHIRFASGVGYRFAVAGTGEGPSGREMSSLVARSSLIFGRF
jgi:hypothetical protein